MDRWLERLSEEPVLGLVALTIVTLFGLVFVFIFWLVARALWDGRNERMRERFWQGLGKDLVIAIGDPAREAAWVQAARAHPPLVLRACIDSYMTRTAGDFREGLARIYRTLGLLDADLVALRSWRWGVRMRALRRLATVVTPEHRDHIARLVDQAGEIRLLVAQIIGRIGTVDDVLHLLRTWQVTSRLSEYPIHVMVDALTPDALRALLPHWAGLGSVEVQRILLGTAARVVPGACRDLLRIASSHPSIEIRIAACHAGARMTTPETLGLMCNLAGDLAWEVRAQAMKGLASHRSKVVAELLTKALGDPSFWVRQNAATALGAHGPDGIARLKEVAATAGDRYARDAAEHVLSDLALGHPAPATFAGAPA